MKYVLTAQEMKAADQRTIGHFGMPGTVLMERAALALKKQAELALEAQMSPAHKGQAAKVLVACGSGNNGGDGFAAARLLLLDGIRAEAWLLGNPDRMTEECVRQKEIFLAYGGRLHREKPDGEYGVVIDAVFGVGLSREVAGDYARMLQALNAMGGYKIAADIPSGISADSGEVLGTAFRADKTVTFGFLKRGLCLYPGKTFAGEVILDSVGITEHSLLSRDTVMLEDTDISRLLPKRKRDGHKGTCGRVLIAAGSEEMCGAAYLAAKAAYVCGAGLVRIYTHRANRDALCALLPEALISCYDSYDREDFREKLGWADTVVIGPGLSQCEISVNLVKEALRCCKKTCIIDADALNILSAHPEFLEGRSCKTIVTPHMLEMARLLKKDAADIRADRFGSIREALQKIADVCILKDAVTVTGDRDGKFYLNGSGNSALSKGGSGDVLAGILAGLMAQGMELSGAAALAPYLHGKAAELISREKGYYSVFASGLTDVLAQLFREFGDEI